MKPERLYSRIVGGQERGGVAKELGLELLGLSERITTLSKVDGISLYYTKYPKHKPINPNNLNNRYNCYNCYNPHNLVRKLFRLFEC